MKRLIRIEWMIGLKSIHVKGFAGSWRRLALLVHGPMARNLDRAAGVVHRNAVAPHLLILCTPERTDGAVTMSARPDIDPGLDV